MVCRYSISHLPGIIIGIFVFVYCSYDWMSEVAEESNKLDLCES
jgi:hypothetical protein